MAAGKLFISKKSYKTYKNTDKTPEFMPSNFFFPKAIQVFPRLILVPRHYIVPIYIYYDKSIYLSSTVLVSNSNVAIKESL